ncbi:MAG: hypothetical protein DMF22_04405 [Verrucomicrobia bacterium]|nr:MAG: hypothetical protein DMF22_04405 [Verrucomicrobiota bacterium]
MRTFLVLICSLALACAAGGAQDKNKSKKQAPKKNQTQSAQHAGAPSAGSEKTKGSQRVTTAGAGGQKTKKAKGPQYATTAGAGAQKTKKAKGPQYATTAGAGAQKTKKAKGSQYATTAGAGGQKTKKAKGPQYATTAGTKTFKAKRFNLQTKTRPATVGSVTFQPNRHIQGSQTWEGSNYTVFRNYSSQWHERNWWRNHYNRVVFVYGGWYAWNAGYWIPAWGYDSNAYYAYDGPIYAYNNLPPDQVIANVQAALQEQGYYQGEVDGLLGPLTRAAVANYQRDHGLYITSAIDRPTLSSLGMT